jgi:hypothetical protein
MGTPVRQLAHGYVTKQRQSRPMARLDEALPRWDFDETHSIELAVSPEQAYTALRELRSSDLRVTGLLMGLRSLGRRRPESRPLIDVVSGGGFALLSEEPPHEVVLGIRGRFWQLRPVTDTPDTDLAGFAALEAGGAAKAVWNFTTEPLSGGRTRVTTVTRIATPDPATKRSFGRYWRVIRPFSGLIRIEMLRALKRRAERSG